MQFQQNKDEKIEMIIRRHWFCVMGLVALITAMSILPVVAYFILKSYINLTQGFYNIFVLSLGIYYMFVATLFFIGWLDYYLDVAIITNERIVDIDQEGLFNRKVSELHFSKVQDATAEVKGIMRTMLNFGDVQVQTAGTQEEFILDEIPNPYKVAKIIIDFQQRCIENLGQKTNTDGV